MKLYSATGETSLPNSASGDAYNMARLSLGRARILMPLNPEQKNKTDYDFSKATT